MRFCFQVTFAMVMVTVVSQPIGAAVVLFGEAVEFTGPGSYSAKIFAQASGQAEEIGGYNIQVDTSNPNITFNSVVYNPVFETVLPASDGSSPVQLQGSDANFSGLALTDGEIGTLATLTFTVDAAGEAPLFGGEVSDLFFGTIAASTAGPISFQTVPEPTSLAFCAIGVVGFVAQRRQRSCQR